MFFLDCFALLGTHFTWTPFFIHNRICNNFQGAAITTNIIPKQSPKTRKKNISTKKNILIAHIKIKHI